MGYGLPVRRRERLLQTCLFCGISIGSAKYCSNAHQYAYQRRILGGAWERGEISGSTAKGEILSWIRQYLIETRGEQCEICGWNERHPLTGRVPLQLDHTDGNPAYNRPENLQLLCPNHHALTVTWGRLNSVDGRKKYGRPERHPDAGRPLREAVRKKARGISAVG